MLKKLFPYLVVLFIAMTFAVSFSISAAPYKKSLGGNNVVPGIYDPNNGQFYLWRGATGSYGIPLVQLSASSTVYLGAGEIQNYSIIAGATSSTNLNPTATACGFMLSYTRAAGATGTIWVTINEGCTTGKGIALAAPGFFGWGNNLQVTEINVCPTPGTATAVVGVQYFACP